MPITYRQLKEFCNQIDERFLDFPALVFTEDMAVSIDGAEIINEETVVYSDGEYENIVCSKTEFDQFRRLDSDFIEIKQTFSPGFPALLDDSSNMHNSEKFNVIQFQSDSHE